MKILETNLNIGSSYKDFDVVEIKDLPDYSSLGIFLRHKVTGLEVFHMYNDDEENLFAFAFATPQNDSTGVAHIIEHSVLCGSKNYPIKDAFVRLSNQSIKTFLNAMTFPDKTVYPAASISQTDYFNLMAVYGDAVFFPSLSEWTFMQEGHRLEINQDGNPEIQGVVYNEMKGCYSSFDNYVSDWAIKSVLPNTIYDCDSGGDPLDIPLLTYEQFKAFHKKYYSPANCQIFLYGNIPTEKQLDFIQERFLDNYVFPENSNIENYKKNIIDLIKPPVAFEKPCYLEKQGPSSDSDNKGCSVTMNWFLGDSTDPIRYIESILLSEILMGHDGSPLIKALLESGVGEDIASNCGITSEMHWILFTTGLRGVNKDDSCKVEKIILDVLEKLCRDGINEADLKAAILSVDFSYREVRRVHGPYSLVLMRRCLRGWLYGNPPYKTLQTMSAFREIKERIEKDSTYIQSLIRELLLENMHRSLVTVCPNDNFMIERQEKEKALVQMLLSKTTEDIVCKKQEQLKQLQKSVESKEVLSLLPHISPSDLSVSVDKIEIERRIIGNDVPLFLSHEATNGIVYFSVGFPVDILSHKEYMLLPLFCTVLNNVGFGGMDWAESAARSAICSGGFGSSLFTSSMMCDEKNAEELYSKDPVFGRDWLFVKLKMLPEQVLNGMDLLSDCLLSADFSDIKRIEDLLIENRNIMKSSIIPSGSEYVSCRASCKTSRSKTIDEIWNGITQVLYSEEIIKDTKNLSEEFSKLLKKLFELGSVIHVITDDITMPIALDGVNHFIKRCNLHSPRPLKNDLEFLPKLYSEIDNIFESKANKGKKELSIPDEVFYAETQVGFIAGNCAASGYTQMESVHESVVSHWLTNSYLWEQIRTIGGAYGAYAYSDACEKVFTFCTYRDPKPIHSLDVFVSCLKNAIENGIGKDDLERVITGCYSKEIQPRSPSSRGTVGFLRYIYGFSYDVRESRIKTLLNTTSKDVIEAGNRILRNINDNFYGVALSGKNMENFEENASNILTLHL